MQQRTRVKICGLTRPDDIHSAVRGGVDAIGLVMYSGSSRAVSLERAKELRAAVPAFVSVVALFVNPTADEVRAVIEQVQPDLLQFHGDETPAFCASFNRRYFRAFRVGKGGLDSPAAVLEACRAYPDAAAWLFDSYSTGYGGSGLVLDTSLLQAVLQAPDARPVILAGGLGADSVAAAIEAVRPYAIDVSSGVEQSKGIKSPEKIRSFMSAVHEADRGL